MGDGVTGRKSRIEDRGWSPAEKNLPKPSKDPCSIFDPQSSIFTPSPSPPSLLSASSAILATSEKGAVWFDDFSRSRS